MATKPFASSADLAPKQTVVEEIADGVLVRTAEGDPNVAAIEADDFVVCFEALATPVAAARWVEELRHHTDKPVRYLVLSHYHAVRVLGAQAFDAMAVVTHEATSSLIDERGKEDWDSELARMPRLFENPESVPGLTHPTITFSDRMIIDLGAARGQLVLAHLGRGHTEGDAVAWLPQHRTVLTGDLVETRAALYTGDAYLDDWQSGTLDRVAELDARLLVGGRGEVARGSSEVRDAVEQSRGFLRVLTGEVAAVHSRGGQLKDAFDAAYQALYPAYGEWPIFEHTLPFDVARYWDELDGIERPRIWTAARDREVWDALQD
ncbi:MAG: MBL fold metallo-hydrolase [Actinomycetota bacterium]|jgi:glyoxylase-like metal-dependent hydrolase (beta-lactamase superfamily II)|nr:MBL fold metallo-hydrolase [Actinomycetota bacterium]